MKRIFLVVAILSVVLVSGCTVPGGFGRDVIKTTQTTQQDGAKDVVVIKNKETIPHSPLLPDRPLILSFLIENLDKIRPVYGIEIELFDAPLFRDKVSEIKCNTENACKPRDSVETLLPGEQKMINFELLSPKEEEIAKIRTDATLSFQVNYKFTGTTTLRVPIVNIDEIEKRQRAGETTTLDIPKYFTSGPVQVDIEVMNQPYILSEYEASIIFKVKDRGDKTKGFLKDSKVDHNALTIKFPKDFEIKDYPKEYFTECKDEGDYKVCKNDAQPGEEEKQKFIDLYRGESIPLYFKIKAPKVTEPYKSYEIMAEIKYIYELRDSVKMTINPYENV